MSLKSEIAALRAAAERLRASKSAAASPQAGAAPEPEDLAQTTIDGLLRAVGETVKDVEADIEKYPQLAALAAFGLGLCLGLAVRPRRR